MRSTLENLSDCWGPPGYEDQVRAYIADALANQGYRLRTDALGNVIVHDGAGPVKLMVVAELDEPGLFVTDVDDDGFLRFAPAGTLQAESLLGETIMFAGDRSAALMAIVGREGGEHDKLELSQLYLDIGATSKEEAEARVPVGSFGCVAWSWQEVGQRVAGKALHSRAGCAVLLETLKGLGSLPSGVAFVFAAQGQLEQRGAKVAAQTLQPEYGLALDAMPAADVPKATPAGVSLGDGVVVKVRDRGVIAHPDMRAWLIELAQANDVPHQLGVQSDGNSAGGPLHIAGPGVPTGLLSLPLRNRGTASEMMDMRDLEAAVRLVAAAVQSIHEVR